MDRMWPGHPEIWFLTDGNGISYKNTIRVHDGNWTQVLHGGLTQLYAAYCDLKYVYLILEDLYPLSECHSGKLAQDYKATTEAELDLVFFYPHGPAPAVERELSICGTGFQPMVSDFPYYTSLQPALWKFDYLMEVSEYAIATGIDNPWKFEFINLGRRHYKSFYEWPSAFSGLFRDGRVNLQALRLLKAKEFSGLRRQLMVEYMRSVPSHMVGVARGKISRGLTRALRFAQSRERGV
jgi:hypothetical protein